MSIVLMIICSIFLFPGYLFGATYTVCSSGCDYTSFSSLFSGVDLAPDDIVEARALAPGGSATFNETIAPGDNDYSSAGHPLIIRARSGDTITIDGQDTREHGIYLANEENDYITIDGFKIEGYTYAGVRVLGEGKDNRISNVIIQNCYMTSYSEASSGLYGIHLHFVDNITANDNTVHITDVEQTHQTDCFILACAQSIIFDGNLCWDENPYQNPETGHNDGIQVIGGLGGVYADDHPLTYTHDLTFKNNILVHDSEHTDSKQLIYIEYEVGGTNLLYNNVVYCTTGSNSNMVSVYNKGYGTAGAFVFYNNTFRTTDGFAVKLDEYISNVTFKNNIVVNTDAGASGVIDIRNTSVTPANFENNQYYGVYEEPFIYNGAFQTWAEWKALGFDDTYSNVGDPLFVSTASYPYNLSLQAGSPAINDGADLSGTFTTDILGNTRTGTWDMGAYEYGAGVTAPTALGVSLSGATLQ